MKFAAISAAMALVTLTNAMPTTPNSGLEARKKEKSECDVYKKDLKKLSSSASAYCSSFIAQTTTVSIPTTVTQVATVISTVPLTATTTTTTTEPAPTETQIVYSDCGVVGYDNGATAAYFFDGSGAFGTFETCSARCKQDIGICLSFAVGADQCLLYTTNAALTAVPVPSSPFTFYAVNCPAPAPVAQPPAGAVTKRKPQEPDVLDYPPAERSALCSCAIAVPSTSTVTVLVTSTIDTTETLTTTATVTTEFSTSVVTPAPVTVTVTATV